MPHPANTLLLAYHPNNKLTTCMYCLHRERERQTDSWIC